MKTDNINEPKTKHCHLRQVAASLGCLPVVCTNAIAKMGPSVTLPQEPVRPVVMMEGTPVDTYGKEPGVDLGVKWVSGIWGGPGYQVVEWSLGGPGCQVSGIWGGPGCQVGG